MPSSPLPIPDAVPFLENRLHPVRTRHFIELLIHAAREAREKSPEAEGVPQDHMAQTQRAIEKPFLATYLNAHCSNLAAENPDYRRVLDRFDVVYADGQGAVWASRILGTPVPERVNAGDFIVEFCRICAREKLRVFLLGSYEGVAEQAARSWREAAPGLGIAGVRDGFFTEQDEAAIASEIHAAKPDVLLVGMGAPRQELWADRWAARLDVPVVWCVGALFEYFSDKRLRAPVWMRRAGLEWFFRLLLEPKRLWRRYIPGNMRFVLRVLACRRAKKENPSLPPKNGGGLP